MIKFSSSWVEFGERRFEFPAFSHVYFDGWKIVDGFVAIEGIYKVVSWSEEELTYFWNSRTKVLVSDHCWWWTVEFKDCVFINHGGTSLDGDPVPQIGDDELAAWEEFISETKKRSSRVVTR